MSSFQSYLIYGPDPEQVRQKTAGLAKKLAVKLAANSPDVFFISPLAQSVTIDQIRELKSHIAQKPFKSKNKFIVIENAHQLTIEAQNALLKTLEEPPSHAIIVLEAKNKEGLLPTILSRVVKIPTALKVADGQPQILSRDMKKLLLQVANHPNPVAFLDQQILILTKRLIEKAKKDQSVSEITAAIEKCQETKRMIEANVNPKFALSHLIFSLNLASK